MEEVTARKSSDWRPHENFVQMTSFRKSELIEPAALTKQHI